jgi:membrane fusion protein (multidrug efflux system)
MAETKTGRKGPTENSLQRKRNGAASAHDGTQEKRKGNKETDGQADDQEKKPKQPFKWTPLKIIGLVVIALVLIVLGTLYYIYASHHATTDDAYTTGHIHNISSRVAGTVIAVLVDDNEFVKQGQVLVKLDPRDYQVKVDQARPTILMPRPMTSESCW